MTAALLTRLAIPGLDPLTVQETPERIQELTLEGHDDAFILLTTEKDEQIYVWPKAIVAMQQVRN